MHKKIGIIIPIYNTQDYLEECLKSVINQTHKNLEIILVNDGSTNEQCLKIAIEYAKNDKRITLINKENGGQSTARNAGIDFLEGKYQLEFIDDREEKPLCAFRVINSNPLKIKRIYKNRSFSDTHRTENPQFEIPQIDFLQFLDSDDWWALDCVQSCLEKSNNVDIVWYAGEAWFGKNRLNFNCDTQVISNIQWLERMIERGVNYFWCVNFCMFRWEMFKKLKIRFINHIIFEDHIFSIMLFAQCEKIYILRKNIFYYRVRPNSTSNHSQMVGKEQISPYFEFLLKDFQNDFAKTKAYFKAGSVLVYVSSLIDFIQNFPNNTIKSLLSEAFLKYYYQASLIELSRIDEDPLGFSSKISVFLNSNTIKTFNEASKGEILLWVKWILKDKISTIDTLNTHLDSIKKSINTKVKSLELKVEFGTATHRIHSHLAYKLGSAMILNSKSLWGYIRMPYVLSYIKEAHKQEIAKYEAKIAKNPSLKLPPLESYADYQAALKEKECFTYKLGKALIAANSAGGGGHYHIICLSPILSRSA